VPEWRKDPLVKRWVVIATERGKRPTDYRVPRDEKKGGRCPLCPGHEGDTPPEVLAFRHGGTAPDTPGWWIRVVPNKFPAVRPEAQAGVRRHGVYEVMDGLGAHEVVVESPGHIANLDAVDERQLEEVIWAWQHRSLELRRDPRLKYIQIFKNFGQTAGASLEHTHSQILAMPMVPVDVEEEMEGFKNYARSVGRCILCDVVAQEVSERQRVVLETGAFVSFAPYASRFPFETWIVPREHQDDFAMIREEQVRDLARVLRSTLLRLSRVLNNPPFNMVLHTAPVNEPDTAGYHWHLEIMPRLTIMAGFELGTGFYINPTPPELAAQVLREEEAYLPPPAYAGAEREAVRYV